MARNGPWRIAIVIVRKGKHLTLFGDGWRIGGRETSCRDDVDVDGGYEEDDDEGGIGGGCEWFVGAYDEGDKFVMREKRKESE